MRAWLRVLAILVATAFSAAGGPTSVGPVLAGGHGDGPSWVDARRGAPLHARAQEPVPAAEAEAPSDEPRPRPRSSASGDDDGPVAARVESASSARGVAPPAQCTHGGLARGELPEAQAFLRVNGSADAHGARA